MVMPDSQLYVLNFCMIIEAREISVFISQIMFELPQKWMYATVHVYIENVKYFISNSKLFWKVWKKNYFCFRIATF